MIRAVPWSDHDPYTDEALLDPWPGYKQMRDAGPAVWLPKYEMFALTQYDSVRRALTDWESFPSRNGVMMNDQMNQVLRGNTLCSDGADHVVEKLVTAGTFGAVTDLASHLPVTVVSNLVGLPERGRERMLAWGGGLFNCFGPMNDQTVASFPVLEEMMVDYMGPSLDTTICATSNAVGLFANYPDQWDLVRADPRLMPSAVNEVLRYDAPIQGFSRYVARDVDMAGVVLPAGSRAIVFYGAANRDERKYSDPDRFDVLRRPGDHLGCGAGPHACVGMNLARIEMLALFTALAKRIRRFTILEVEPLLNKRSARLQDITGRRLLTWWKRHTRIRRSYS